MSPNQSLTLESLARLFEGATEKHGYWQAQCPAHEDRQASLSIGIDEKDPETTKLLVHCHAGCDPRSILERVGLTFADLTIHRNGHQGKKELDRTYDYVDADGRLMYQSLRYRNPKSFTQRRPDGSGGWIWKTAEAFAQGIIPYLPYHLPQLLAGIAAGQTIYIVEGEKDVETLERFGLVATSNHGGAGKWRQALNQYLRGADVVLLPDNDDAGYKHGRQVASMLKPIVARLRICILPDLPDHGDVTDWLNAGHEIDELLELADQAPNWDPVALPLIWPNGHTEAAATEPAEKKPAAGPTTIHGINLTDLGNAERLIARHGADLHFVPEAGRQQWLIWNGRAWDHDHLGETYRYAMDTVRFMYRESSELPDNKDRMALAAWAMRSESKTRLDAMVSLAQYLPGVSIPINRLDTSPWLLNVANGTLDLLTGELCPHRREDLLTHCLDIVYDPDAQAPLWTEFLGQIMDHNQSLIGFLQRAIGYSLTGNISEQCLFFLHGTGANGKSTFIETIRSLLGPYVQQTPTETLMYKNDPSGANNDIARLRGARLVAATETDENQRLAETLIKQLSGGDRIAARFLFGEYFEFEPTFKIWLVGNHRPEIRGTDHAIWRRIHLVPFNVTIPEAQRDPNLREKLMEERTGILTWAVKGCVDWQVVGLGAPPEVKAATEAYRTTMDTFESWRNENTVCIPTANTQAGKLYADYLQWCKSAGEHELSRTKFGLRLTDCNFVKSRTNAGFVYQGIGLIHKDEGSNNNE